jgi:hypothetical protein
LRYCSQQDNADEAIRCIITKLHIHPPYAHLYLRLLKEMYSRYEQVAITEIKSFMNDLKSSIPATIQQLNNEPKTSDYDDYCKYNKVKVIFLQKFEAALLLDNSIYKIDILKAEIAKSLYDALICVESISIVGLVTELVYILVIKSSNEEKVTIVNTINSIYACITHQFPELPKKILFRWEDIYTHLNILSGV